MFENMTEQEAREMILESVREYADRFHNQNTTYKRGERISYASRVYDHEEMVNLADSTLDFWLTAGRYTERFEKEFGEFLGVRHVALVNSGSSANLLAFAALTSHLLKERRIIEGDEVITVAAGFPTTVSPIIQCGVHPVFVDVTLPSADIDPALLEGALSPRTKAVMLAHTLGNPFNIKAVKAFCDAHGLWLVEDNCDALGSLYTLDGKTAYTGTFGDIGTSSFYPAHHMTMGEGGAVYTNDPLLARIVRSMRDWGRDCICPPGHDNYCGRRFSRQDGDLPFGYDHKYVYSHFGYNLKATDMQAAVGCAQLKKLPQFAKARRENFQYLKEALRGTEDSYILPVPEENSDPCWFGFLITVREGTKRSEVVNHLESHGVQTRMLFAGNLTKHPCMTDDPALKDRYRIASELKVTDRIMTESFWIGVYPGMTQEKLAYMAELLREAAGKGK